MNANDKNQIVEKAQANKKTIMDRQQKSIDEGLTEETEKIIAMAYDNEGSIVYAANQLEVDLRGGIERLQRALHYLKLDKSDCLNGCGVLQGLNHDIDTNIILLQQLERNRQHYRHLIK